MFTKCPQLVWVALLVALRREVFTNWPQLVRVAICHCPVFGLLCPQNVCNVSWFGPLLSGMLFVYPQRVSEVSATYPGCIYCRCLVFVFVFCPQRVREVSVICPSFVFCGPVCAFIVSAACPQLVRAAFRVAWCVLFWSGTCPRVSAICPGCVCCWLVCALLYPRRFRKRGATYPRTVRSLSGLRCLLSGVRFFVSTTCPGCVMFYSLCVLVWILDVTATRPGFVVCCPVFVFFKPVTWPQRNCNMSTQKRPYVSAESTPRASLLVVHVRVWAAEISIVELQYSILQIGMTPPRKHTHAYTHTRTHAHRNTQKQTHTHTHTRTHTRAHTHTHTHTHGDTHTHARAWHAHTHTHARDRFQWWQCAPCVLSNLFKHDWQV